MWSSCTLTCDGGMRTRTCTSPSATNGGATCVGDSIQSCNTRACKGSATMIFTLLALDWSDYDTDELRDQFNSKFISDVSTALSASTSRLSIVNVADYGDESVGVELMISSTNNGTSAMDLANTLSMMITNTSSPLYNSGTLTSQANPGASTSVSPANNGNQSIASFVLNLISTLLMSILYFRFHQSNI
jgi:hypothetical protein